MRHNSFAEKCFPCYLLIRWLGIPKTCIDCNLDQFTCNSQNYILHFTGCGKYNNKYLCLTCLEKRMEH